MSPRAASQLESLGFTNVYDYAAGKADWGSAGLPLEGDDPSEARAGAYARTDVPTCRLDERMAEVSTRVEQAGWDTSLVVDDSGVVLGRIGRSSLRREADVSADEAMTPGPSTVRPSARLERMAARMRERNLTSLPITTSDGRLVGLLLREDAEAALARSSRQARSPS